MRFLFRATLFLGLIVVLAACGGQSKSNQEAPSAAEQPAAEQPAAEQPAAEQASASSAVTDTPAPVAAASSQEPTAALEATPTEAPAAQESQDWSQNAWQDGDLYVLGNPEAPIRLVDYSDFL